MRTSVVVAACVAAAALVTACGGGSSGGGSSGGAGVSQSPPTGATSATKTMANFIGKGLQTAQDDAQAAGFYNLTSHDATGRERHQILDRDWKVCFQTPAAGKTVSLDGALDFGVVKLDEACPASDQSGQSPSAVSEGKTMPNLIGKSLNVATAALPSGTSTTSKDISGQDRIILVESNWKVCSQDPKAGAQFNGQPVTFGVVKSEESCP